MTEEDLNVTEHCFNCGQIKEDCISTECDGNEGLSYKKCNCSRYKAVIEVRKLRRQIFLHPKKIEYRVIRSNYTKEEIYVEAYSEEQAETLAVANTDEWSVITYEPSEEIEVEEA